MAGPVSTHLPRFKRQLILGNVAVVLVLVLAAWLLTGASRRSHEARAQQKAAGLAQTLSRSIGANFKQVEDSLQATLKRLDELPAAGAAELRDVARVAAEELARVPALDALRVTDANGLVLNPGDRPAISMADRDYFRAARAAPGQTVVSEPLRGRLVGGWGLVIARARLDAAGHFTGIVYASLKTERLRDELKRADVGAQGAVSLRSHALQLVARYSPMDANPESGMGSNKVSEPLRAALAASPERGSFISRAALDDVERLTAYEAVPGYPMVLLVGLATEEFHAAWRREAGLWAAGLSLLGALLAAASVVFYRRARGRQPA